MKKVLGLLAVSLSLLAGCATTTRGTLRSNVGEYDAVFQAAREAALEAGFGVTNASREEGLISGERGIIGGGQHTLLTVLVRKGAPGASLELTITPPPGAFGTVSDLRDAFVTAMRRKVPDIQVQ